MRKDQMQDTRESNFMDSFPSTYLMAVTITTTNTTTTNYTCP